MTALTKPNESIRFENGRVIKYFDDPSIVLERVERAKKLKRVVPEIIESKKNHYVYNFVPGETLAKINDVTKFRQFLKFCEQTIWQRKNLSEGEMSSFKQKCGKFYLEKTMNRVEKFFKENDIKDQEEVINGGNVPMTRDLLSQVDWEKINNGIPVTFHGDLQPENIIVCDKGFKLIDWRHNFGGSTEYGDIYYDFAKLYHALIITRDVILNDQFNIKMDGPQINYNFLLKSNLVEYKEIFENFLNEKGYDLDKVKILSAITFLNIAPLHLKPYNNLLYYLGKNTLFNEFNQNNPYKLKQFGDMPGVKR